MGDSDNLRGLGSWLQMTGVNSLLYIGRFQAIKTDVLLIFPFITGDKTEFLSPMMFSNEYITGIWLSEFYLINFLLLSIKFNTNV